MSEEQNKRYWFDPIWLQQNKLNEKNIKDYFKQSIFFETKGYQDDNIEINVQIYKPPSYFVLTKAIKENQRKMLINTYYSYDGKIFAAISMNQAIQSKLHDANGQITNIISLINQNYDWSSDKNEWKFNQEDEQQDINQLIQLKDEFM